MGNYDAVKLNFFTNRAYTEAFLWFSLIILGDEKLESDHKSFASIWHLILNLLAMNSSPKDSKRMVLNTTKNFVIIFMQIL